MSAQNRKKVNKNRQGAWWESLWFGGLLQVVLAIYLALALTGPVSPWWGALQGAETGDLLAQDNPGGPVGGLANLALRVTFGAAWCWLLPVLLFVEGVGRLVRRPGVSKSLWRRALPLWLISTAWIAQPEGPLAPAQAAAWGGVVGVWLGRGFHLLFGLWGGRIFLTFLLLCAVFLVLRPWLVPVLRRLNPLTEDLGTGLARLAESCRHLVTWPFQQLKNMGSWVAGLFHRGPAPESYDDQVEYQEVAQGTSPARRLHGLDPDPNYATPGDAGAISGTHGAMSNDGADYHPGSQLPGDPTLYATNQLATNESVSQPRPTPARRKLPPGPMAMPDLEMLRDADVNLHPSTPAELDAAADLLESTLRSFGVEGEVKDVRPGPVVTTFEYQPASGIKVSQIVQRVDDLALAMKARSIRMEAPIPGKAAVGIEIPNATTQIVRLKEVVRAARTIPRTPLSVVLGKDVVGQPIVIDVAKLPHLLVAGSTGSGKSVCLNSLICNLLLHNGPDRMRMILIDPKMLEMSVYNGIPHLLLPVVTDTKEALRSLKWMVSQMELRYRQLARVGVRDIGAYNTKVERGEVVGADGQQVTEPMPFYLTIVDELADLMIQLGQEFEMPITRLAQKARAVGIHLVLATQRPSVDVLTGVIKANIPCRIAFRVIQKNDSRTILDMNGAEQLLGSGDMLYLQPGRALPVRVHGSLIEVGECESIVEHWKQYESMTEDISLDVSTGGDTAYTGEDDLFEEAKRIVVLHQSGSTSLLQRRLRVGYTRAGRLIDMLEEAGVVGPFTGSKARDVLLKPEDLPDWDGPAAGGAEA